MIKANVYINLGNKIRKRTTGEPVLRHPCNKRQRIRLDSIPDNMKMDALKTIPDQFVIDMFNTIAKAALPTFDDLVMAAWNVVCIYEFVGTEFPGFHTAIVELKSVLQEFDPTHRKERPGARKEQRNDQGQVRCKAESPASATGPVLSHEQRQISVSHNYPKKQPGPTMQTNTMDLPAQAAPVQLPDLIDTMTMDGNHSPEPVFEGRNIPPARPHTEPKSSEIFDLPKEAKTSQSNQKQKSQLNGRTNELTDEAKKKQVYVAQLKDTRRQLYELESSADHRQLSQGNRAQFEVEPIQPASLEQRNSSCTSSMKQNDHNKLLIENSHYKGTNGKPKPIGPKPTKQVRSTQDMDS